MSLAGREREQLAALAGSTGGAVQLAGVGRTALLSTLLPALSVVCVAAEQHMPYAALHQVLLPLLGELSALPAPRRAALEAAFGLADGTTSPRLAGLAALDLLAGRGVVVVEDAQWLDRESREVLGFVARRLAGSGAVLVVAADVPVLDGVPALCSADDLLDAAERAAAAGRPAEVERILDRLRGRELTVRQRALATWLPTSFDDGVGQGAGPAELIGLAEAVVADGDTGLGLRIFWSVAMRCFWTEPGPAVRERIMAVARSLALDPRDPHVLAMTAYVAPIEQGDAVIAGLRAALDPDGGAGADSFVPGDDPATARLLGSAALQVGAFAESVRFSAAAQRGFRATGQLGLLTRALAVEAWSRTRLGDLANAEPAAAEALRLAEQTRQPYMRGLAAAVQAEIAALRGDHAAAAEHAALAERVGLAAGARPVLATVQLARALAALGEGRHADAFAAVRRVHDPADPAYQLALRRYVLPELVEAAVRSGHADEAAKLVEGLDGATTSPALAGGLRYARALLAGDEDAESLFTAALDAETTGWHRARVQLAFGAWLRRRRRAAHARPHLKAAAEAFEAFGTAAWAQRAREELRASGETRGGTGELTEHELTIARLAADGLTNREIGERMHLSHRTVSTHLHRIFPKLGVTARAELGPALAGHPR
ncbi:helix-turn-helix transcriptional regulator [Nocardia sp. NRRL S-836]|uniref:helix-turn-helix transcriptional regulator n=1 Tax=Nocardia sp. NRRL S-836 TaxID=1519492 RepID=UPI0006AF9D2B|nr:helix-turn-helix transcriptional regulator [Nocardia sp. NRRL S-836]KOV85178.1 hypothetical protein ADL03_13125 [Nocardia sp. NRRL S-836]